MISLSHVVTTNGNHHVQKIRDFAMVNNLVFTRGGYSKATNTMTGDTYFFHYINKLSDAYNLAGLSIHNYIHLDSLPQDNEIKYFLLSRLRRPFT